MNEDSFENPKINIKIKLAALWASVLFCYLYGDYFTLYVPGKLEGMIAGKFVEMETTQGVLMAAALLMTVPSLMVFLSLVLAPALNRLANIVLGIVYGVVMFLTMLMEVWNFYLFLGVVEIGLTLLIVWYAWRWPRES